jgi:hypothetical protein
VHSAHSALRRLAVLVTLAVPLSLAVGAGAGAAPPPPPPAPSLATTPPLPTERAGQERAESAVVLVVLDGVRWQDVFGRAEMPALRRFIDTRAVAIGAPGSGAEITATGPQFISLPGYLEIFAGRPDPRCASNACARTPERTVADDVVESAGEGEAAVVTSWPNIARAASAHPERLVLSAGRRLVAHAEALRADAETAALLDQGAGARPFPGEGDYRPDAWTARLALRVLETARPRFLFVGLGDGDEYAHRSEYGRYLDALRAADAFLGRLLETLGAMGARGRHTTVILTADHGRARDFRDHGPRFPESGRVWLVAGGGDVPGHGLVAASRRHTLSDVAPTVRALLGIPGDGAPIDEVVRNNGGATLSPWP